MLEGCVVNITYSILPTFAACHGSFCYSAAELEMLYRLFSLVAKKPVLWRHSHQNVHFVPKIGTNSLQGNIEEFEIQKLAGSVKVSGLSIACLV